MSLKKKIILFFILSILVTAGLLFFYMYRKANDISEESEERFSRMLSAALSKEVQNNLDLTEVNVRSVVENQKVCELFAKRDREALLAYLGPMYEGMQDTFSQAQFHLQDSTSFLRLHKPEKFGDNLRAFRITVNEANEKKVVVKGIEEGVAGFGFRVVMPIFYEGSHIGSFEFGRKFDEGFLKTLQTTYGGEFSLYKFGEEGEEVYVSGTQQTEQIYEEGLTEKIREGETVCTRSDEGRINNYMIPFTSFDGKVLGFLQFKIDRSDILKQNREILLRMTLVTVVLMLMIILLASLFLLRSFKPLYRLMEEASAIAEGDFSHKMQSAGRDEIGLLTNSLGKISESLKKTLSSVSRMAADVAETSENLSAASQEMNASCEEVNRNVLEVSERASEQLRTVETSKEDVGVMAQNITDLNSGIIRINESMESVLQSTGRGIEVSKMLEDKIHKLKTSSQQTTENIHKLNQSSKEIEGIITTIQGIADETNLLALNASIEAARAGEAGRGFAVVAGEVSKLAEQSRDASGRIDALIKEIQSDIRVAVSSMDESNKEVDQGVEVIRDSNVQFGEIKDEVQLTVGQLSEITLLVDQVYLKIDQVLKSFENIVEKSADTTRHVSRVKDTSQDQTRAMSEVAESAIGLAELAADLKEAMAAFRY